MKTTKRLKQLLTVVFTAFFLCGCPAIPLLLVGGGIGLTGWSYRELNKMSIKQNFEANLEDAWQASLTTLDEMGIEVTDKKLEENEGVIEGKTFKHKKIVIVLATVTSSTVQVGVNAKEKGFSVGFTPKNDVVFATTILNKIGSKCRTAAQFRYKGKPLILIVVKRSNVRAAGNVKSRIVFVVPRGTKLQQVGKSGNWYKIVLPSGKTGYIYKTLVKPTLARTETKRKGI